MSQFVKTTSATEPITPPVQKVVSVHLENIPLLKGIGKQALEKMASALQIRALPRGAFALRKNACNEYLIFLLSGRLQAVDVTDDGHETGARYITPGDYFGEMSVIDGFPRVVSVVACEASLVAFLPRTEALDLMYNNPLVAERLLKRMVSIIRAASDSQAILSMPNAFQRVFALLNQSTKVAPGGLVIIEKMLTQQEIATRVNTSRETVSRAIQVLIQKGVVEKDMRRLIVRHPDALRDPVSLLNKSSDVDVSPSLKAGENLK